MTSHCQPVPSGKLDALLLPPPSFPRPLLPHTSQTPSFPSGAATNWNLARVEVANVEEGSKTLFTYNSYLNKDCTTACIYPQSSYTCKVRAPLS